MTIDRGVLVLLVLAAGCARGGPRAEQVLEVKAAFSDETVVGELRASWRTGAEARAGNGGAERPLHLRVVAVNRLADRLYLRLRGLRLRAPRGAIAVPGAAVECVLAGDAALPLVDTTVWLPAADLAGIGGLAVDSLAVPLSERGRAFHREFLRRRRPTLTEIDAELDAYAAAPPCVAVAPR